MVKPSAFQNSFVALSNTPYLCSDDLGKEKTASGGVLSRGQIVWLRDIFNPFSRPRSTTAFVEGIGLISVDPRWLVSRHALSADASEHPVARSLHMPTRRLARTRL